MKTKVSHPLLLALALLPLSAALSTAQPSAAARPQGPCDLYAAAGDPCAAAHSTTRALYASYNGPLYQVLRQSDAKTLDIGVVQPTASPTPDPGGYANAAAQDTFCAHTYCWISKIYDQSPKHNDLTQAPRGGFSGPAMGGSNNLPLADMAPISIMGHKVYGVFIAPGMGLRQNSPRGTAVDDQSEGQYWVINGLHFNSGCCFDYGNAEIDSRDDGNGTMETTYFGDATPWYHGNPPGPWIMTDQENNLVGCVNADSSKLCANLPNITWRFVTGIAKGEPHHWTSMGGDAQHGTLSVMFDGPRINASYDPMRKQGAILLGNGGDNSNSSQGTFYEGAMTAAGTFPTNATDQRVQANVVAANYAPPPLTLTPATAMKTPPGLQTFLPGSSQNTTITFTNTTNAPAAGVTLSIAMPTPQWTSTPTSKNVPAPVPPGSSVSATFKVTSGPAPFNGDLVGNASWKDPSSGATLHQAAAEKVRNVSPIKINEFRVSTSSPANPTNSFIELYNAGSSEVDLANWTLTEHPTQQAAFSAVTIPAGHKLAAGGFYLLGLSNSGLAIPARTGDTTLSVSSTTGMSVGDTLSIDTGSSMETRKIAKIGTAASSTTTLWQPVPEEPVMTIPAGSTSVPVTSVAGFVVGEKIALGYGATPVAAAHERYEVSTVTAVGKPGTQAFLAADSPAGSTNIKVTSVANISVGDKIRLDIDSIGHGIETVTVSSVGTQANRSTLTADAKVGATRIEIRNRSPFAVGDNLLLGTPANLKTYTITAVTSQGSAGTAIDFKPAFTEAHSNGEDVVQPGTGLGLAAPLRFHHTANLPFSDRGTGITLQAPTAFAHASNEPVQALGSGIALDRPVEKEHAINAVVEDASVSTAGYQGKPAPNQWFGGPALSAAAGSLVLRDAAGLVVDSLNYGLLVDPWAAQGYQAASGSTASGCYVTTPGSASGAGISAARSRDGVDTSSNCTDFVTSPATLLSAASATGATNIKVASVAGFVPGQPITLDAGANLETAIIAKVGTAGATTVGTATAAGATVIPVASPTRFGAGQTITIGSGADSESAVVVSGNRFGATVTVAAPLTLAHSVGAPVSGTGITLAAALTRAHAAEASVAGPASTPGAPNH